MKLRRTMTTRRTLTAVAITTGLVLTVAGCGGGDDGGSKSDKPGSSAPAADKGDEGGGKSETPTEGQALAEAKGDGVTLVINAAERDAGGFVTVSGKVTNASDGLWTGGEWRGDEQELRKNGGSIAGASLVDSKGKKKYLVLRDTSGRCLCTKFEGGIESGQTVDWFAQFPAPPEETSKVSFQVGAMPPAPIEISEGE
ncbi:hypothetical protein [Streptomyces sp. AN091965]|uniref:hypothetical protein n=1 Tax=Streptomyces sp. AN091965 TaxID=2927803 RepID=UPI001F60D62E|nr:hypothetical protein [Streptomyces sp. AN091965]MCI3932782.1 hypothetical protein [Streptomyces sp. AN091965]